MSGFGDVRRCVIGVDASSSCIGLARLDGDGVQIRTVIVLGDGGRTCRERLHPVMSSLRPGVTLVGVEEPPPTSRSTTRRGSQAVVGFGIGRAAGWVESSAGLLDLPTVLVPVRTWRATRDRFARPLRVGMPPGAGDVEGDETERRRDREKAFGYALASRLWPDAVEALVEAARRRAVGKDQQPWRFAGVEDGCEAALIALHLGMT